LKGGERYRNRKMGFRSEKRLTGKKKTRTRREATQVKRLAPSSGLITERFRFGRNRFVDQAKV